MVQYRCELCDFDTRNKADYKRHCKTKKHQKKVQQNTDSDGSNLEVIKSAKNAQKLHYFAPKSSQMLPYEENRPTCEYCYAEFTRNSNLNRHLKICNAKKKHENDVNDKIKMAELKLQVKMQKAMIKKLESDESFYKNMAIGMGILAEKSQSNLTYAIRNYSNAPAMVNGSIEAIKQITNKSDHNLIDEIFAHYNNSNLAKYIGDPIVEIYTHKDPTMQSIWNTDTSRLSYLIRKTLDKEDRWIIDKKGANVTKYIINPICKKIRTMALEYRQEFDDESDAEKMMLVNDICVRLVHDIDKNKLQKGILKYISPHFHMTNKDKELISVDTKKKKKKRKSKKSS